MSSVLDLDGKTVAMVVESIKEYSSPLIGLKYNSTELVTHRQHLSLTFTVKRTVALSASDE